jgi:hypothetical protein
MTQKQANPPPTEKRPPPPPKPPASRHGLLLQAALSPCNGHRDLGGRLLGLCLTCNRLGFPGRPGAAPAAAPTPSDRVWQCVNWTPLR